jgi:hypothetical protein
MKRIRRLRASYYATDPPGHGKRLQESSEVLKTTTRQVELASDDPPGAAIKHQPFQSLQQRGADGYVDNSTRVWCWRPEVLASA